MDGNLEHATGAVILPQHAALLRASAIDDAVVAARGYRSIDSRSALKRLGFSDSQSTVPGLLIPIHGVGREIVTYQYRPDEPRIRDGKLLKYETPAKSRMRLDVPPAALPWLGDPSRPLFITEGARKADAAVSRGLCCVALLGVWNWRGTNETGGKLALADWESVALNGRLVIIVFDSDIMEKVAVHGALVRLKSFLETRTAHVQVAYLPSGDGGTKTGLDDYFAEGHSVDDLLALTSTTVRPPVGANDTESNIPYQMSESGIVWIKRSTDGPIPVPLTNFSARIVSDIGEDDGAEVRRVYDLEARRRGREYRFTVPAEKFPAMNWAAEHLGASAILEPGQNVRDHARVAIQKLAGEITERRRFTHTGWREIGGQHAYLHGGGAIGPDGPLPDIDVALPEPLANYTLPNLPSGDDLKSAILASLKMLDVASLPVTVPVYAAVWRPPLGPIDASVHITGPTQAGKSELAALGQQHYGRAMERTKLPASWLSTGNALESLAFSTKDALLTIDDFCPTGTQADVQRYHRDADRVFRAQGNRSGRGRLTADARLRIAKPPRGLILSSGEDVPRGQSLRARMMVVEVGPNDLDWTRLGACQRDAASGLYAAAFAGYVQWLAGQYDGLAERVQARVLQLREYGHGTAGFRRTPDLAANLGVGLRFFLEFAVAANAISTAESERLWSDWWTAICGVAAAQAAQQAGSEPTRRFLELLQAAIASGHAHVAGINGNEPELPGRWGWREGIVGSGEYTRSEWRAQGHRVGWIDGEDLYLEPDASFVTVQKMAHDAGDALPIGSKTLHKRLDEKGLLVAAERDRGRLTVRRTIEGARRVVLHIRAESLLLQQSTQWAQLAQGRPESSAPTIEADPPGSIPWADSHVDVEESTQETGPQHQRSEMGSIPSGTIGPIGPIPETNTARQRERERVRL